MATLTRQMQYIREEHENDTAVELDQVEHAEGLCVLWQRIAADGRVTQREAREEAGQRADVKRVVLPPGVTVVVQAEARG